MSVIQSSARLIRWKPVLGVTLVLAVFSLIAGPLGPLGDFWRPSLDIPITTATGVQIVLVLGLLIAEALTFGLGMSFLVFGYPLVRAIAPASIGLTRAAHLAISWVLANWWVHDSLHIHLGMELNGMLAVEYGFHITLMIAGAVLAYFFLTILRQGQTMA